MKREDALKKWLPIVKMGVESMPELEDAVNIAISDVEKIEKLWRLVEAHHMNDLKSDELSGFEGEVLEVLKDA